MPGIGKGRVISIACAGQLARCPDAYSDRMRQRGETTLLAILLLTLSTPVQAQSVPIWLVAAVLSPIPVFLLCLVLGLLTRSVRTGAIHAGLVLGWIVLFALACYFVENDYVIWTPLALYVLHAVLLFVLTLVQIARRVSGHAARPR